MTTSDAERKLSIINTGIILVGLLVALLGRDLTGEWYYTAFVLVFAFSAVIDAFVWALESWIKWHVQRR